MIKKAIFLLLLVSSIFPCVFGQTVVSEAIQEDKKELSSGEEKTLKDMVLTAIQPSLNLAESK